MMSRIPNRVLPLIAVLAMTAPARPQTATPPCKPSDSSQAQNKKSGDNKQGKETDSNAPCAPASSQDPSAAERFPFPGEKTPSAPSAPGQQPDAPGAPAPDGKPPSAADKFPFPGSASAPPMPGSESSSDSSSSSSSSSSSADDTDRPADAGSPEPNKANGSVRRRLPKVEKLQSDEERAEEDLKVSKFYENADNLAAAYLRAKDAVKYQPSDPETHFALAHVAQKMDKREEAANEYNKYLELAPDGLRIKEVQKQLAKLQH